MVPASFPQHGEISAHKAMVLGGSKAKFHSKNIKDALTRPPKMAPAPSSPHGTSRSAKQPLHPLPSQFSNCESDLDTGSTQIVIHSGMFKQFEQMLQKALKQNSDHITDKLTHEIRELGQRTAELEVRVNDLENHTQDYIAEFENLKEENSVLESRLEDQENRDHRSNLQIRGIPETVLEVQATMLALFQELQLGMPVERLEIDKVHRALAPHKNGLPRHIIAKIHYYRTKEQFLAAARGKDVLSFQGHTYQIFADLSPLIVAKRMHPETASPDSPVTSDPITLGIPFLGTLHSLGDQICLPHSGGITDSSARSGPLGPNPE